jgi:hypothetical protein
VQVSFWITKEVRCLNDFEVLNPKGSKRRVPYGGEPLSSMASV